MTEASPIIADTVTSTVILTLSNIAVITRVALLAGARAVEAVSVCTETVLTSLQRAVTPVPPLKAHAFSTAALAVCMALGGSTKVD